MNTYLEEGKESERRNSALPASESNAQSSLIKSDKNTERQAIGRSVRRRLTWKTRPRVSHRL